MLANSLTMDEEDAVQAELLQLQAEAVRPFRSAECATLLIEHPLLSRCRMHRRKSSQRQSFLLFPFTRLRRPSEKARPRSQRQPGKELL